MILAVNIGNTNTICAVGARENNRKSAMRTKEACQPEDFTTFLEEQFGADIWCLLQGCIISSVVPAKTLVIVKAIHNKTRKPLQLIDISECDMDFSVYKSKLGEDRIVCCMSAAAKYKAPIIVVDLGTATTFNIVSPDRVFLGGAILTGIQTGLTALTRHTALLPIVNDFSNVRLVGSDTEKSLVSGAIIGTACAIEGYVNRVQAQLGNIPTVIITGGNAPLVMPHCNFDFIYEPDLLINGLFELYDN